MKTGRERILGGVEKNRILVWGKGNLLGFLYFVVPSHPVKTGEGDISFRGKKA